MYEQNNIFIRGMKGGLQILPLFSLLKYRFRFTFVSHLRMNLCRFIFTRVKMRVFTEKEKSQGILYSMVSPVVLILKESHKPQNCHQGCAVLTQLTTKEMLQEVRNATLLLAAAGISN